MADDGIKVYANAPALPCHTVLVHFKLFKLNVRTFAPLHVYSSFARSHMFAHAHLRTFFFNVSSSNLISSIAGSMYIRMCGLKSQVEWMLGGVSDISICKQMFRAP